MANPDIASQNRRPEAPLPDLKPVFSIEGSRGLLIRPRSNETSSVIGYIYNIGSDRISTGVRACQLTREQSSRVVDEERTISAFAKSSGIWFRGRAEVSFRLA
jgi:hypothetical protein